jgi:hypothetical protein
MLEIRLMLAVLYMATVMGTYPRQTARHCQRVSMQIRSSRMDKTDTIYQDSQQHLIRMVAVTLTPAVVEFNHQGLIRISMTGSKYGMIVRIHFELSEFKQLGMCR